MLKAVIFDMDGGVIDGETIHFEANKKVLADMGKELGYDYYRQFIGGTLTGMWEVMQKDGMVASDLTIDELNGLSYAATNALLEANGGYPPVKGACELVKELRKSDMKMAIASSSMYERIERTAKSLGVDDCFDVYVSGEQLKRPKPAPDIFIKAAELLGVSPSECIVIEDSGNGVNAAKAAGMACVGYINPGSGDQDLSAADYLVESLEGLETSFFNMVHAHCNGEP